VFVTFCGLRGKKKKKTRTKKQKQQAGATKKTLDKALNQKHKIINLKFSRILFVFFKFLIFKNLLILKFQKYFSKSARNLK